MIPASESKRFMAYIVDTYLLLKLGNILIILLAVIGALCVGKDNAENFGISLLKFSPIIYFIFVSIYYIFFECSRNQGTLGKKFLGLYVSDKKNQRISFLNSCFRYFLFVIPMMPIYFSSFLAMIRKDSGIELSLLIFTVPILLLIAIGPMFFTQEDITLYDMISRTRVSVQPLKIRKKITNIIVVVSILGMAMEFIKFLIAIFK